jgi:hypothetical protein
VWNSSWVYIVDDCIREVSKAGPVALARPTSTERVGSELAEGRPAATICPAGKGAVVDHNGRRGLAGKGMLKASDKRCTIASLDPGLIHAPEANCDVDGVHVVRPLYS